ncbi:DUF6156 family protein [Beijerinckia indica]|uniref:YD repeat protein n=1 Tax=Beijerinckia indica subsp. indica (strain ATCC 9039 / DSM 1715 / NCIMB 8712) TaxID=395963 RepID=B2IEH4_BEII9|nr:DUF6156 family protein [Beijerinckia indica]ACB95572.1 conserved hypothetical protein [Beijerinckia indica subsp. indica ATCC 9039]
MNDTEDYIENPPEEKNYDTSQDPENARYFVSYTGVKLPVRMINPLEPEALRNRNTFIVAYFDEQERLLGFKKMVYGEIEISHKYEYDTAGIVRRAEIFMDDDTTELFFDENGAPSAG